MNLYSMNHLCVCYYKHIDLFHPDEILSLYYESTTTMTPTTTTTTTTLNLNPPTPPTPTPTPTLECRPSFL